MPGSLSHLTSRFFDFVSARPLSGSEHRDVESQLGPQMARVFFQQADADQRHGYHAAQSVIAAGRSESDVVVTALVHDIGKRHAELGAMGRSVASLLILAHLPLSRRMITYRDHGLVGAEELAEMGAPSLAIDFARHHHGVRPSTIDQETWDVLQSADQPPKAGGRRPE